MQIHKQLVLIQVLVIVFDRVRASRANSNKRTTLVLFYTFLGNSHILIKRICGKEN